MVETSFKNPNLMNSFTVQWDLLWVNQELSLYITVFQTFWVVLEYYTSHRFKLYYIILHDEKWNNSACLTKRGNMYLLYIVFVASILFNRIPLKSCHMEHHEKIKQHAAYKCMKYLKII